MYDYKLNLYYYYQNLYYYYHYLYYQHYYYSQHLSIGSNLSKDLLEGKILH